MGIRIFNNLGIIRRALFTQWGLLRKKEQAVPGASGAKA
jgi:hypothetical protein